VGWIEVPARELRRFCGDRAVDWDLVRIASGKTDGILQCRLYCNLLI
jgi:hypothetical protein